MSILHVNYLMPHWGQEYLPECNSVYAVHTGFVSSFGLID